MDDASTASIDADDAASHDAVVYATSYYYCLYARVQDAA